jgi:hypothetical protein
MGNLYAGAFEHLQRGLVNLLNLGIVDDFELGAKFDF